MAMNKPIETHRLRIGLGVTVQILLALALVVGLNLLASRNPVPGLRGDWTLDGRNTLHPDTAAVLKGLKDPVELVLFYSPLASQASGQRAYHQEVFHKTDLLIREAGYLSKRILVETVNPATNPDRARAALRRTGLEKGTATGSFLLVHARGRNIQLTFRQLAAVDSNTGQLRYGGEDALYRAVNEVTRHEERMVTFVQGRGEVDPTIKEQGLTFANLLIREAYRVGRFDITREEESIPSGTTVLVLARPLLDYSEVEIEKIREEHSLGRGLLIFINARTPAENLRRFLRTQFKMDLADRSQILHDPKGAMRKFPDWIMMDKNFSPDHPVSRPLARAEQKVAVILPNVRPLVLKAPGVCDFLLMAHFGAWPDVLKKGNTARHLDEDEKVFDFEKQRFPLVVAVDPRKPGQQGAGENSGRVVLFCSGDMASSQILDLPTANRALLINAVHWVSGKDSGRIIPPVSVRHARLILTGKEDRMLFWTVVVLPSAIMGVLGLLVFLLRRG